jgi:hypothetical protein
MVRFHPVVRGTGSVFGEIMIYMIDKERFHLLLPLVSLDVRVK